MSTRLLHYLTNIKTWHHCLGHISKGTVAKMAKKDLIIGLQIIRAAKNGQCKDCIIRKQSCRPFDAEVLPKSHPYRHMVFDLFGPAHIQTTSGKVWMMTTVD